MIKNMKLFGLTSIIFSITMIILFTPVSEQVFGANNKQEYFNLSLVISNSAPTIDNVASTTGTPNEATTSTINILFNVTDSNGYVDVDPTQAYANVTLNTVTRESSSCQDVPSITSGNTRGINCSITMQYDDEPGTWDVSVTATDSSTEVVSNNAATMTYNYLYAFQLTKDSVSFSANAGEANINASNDPQILNNTGNGAFTTINVTGYELSNGADTIGAGNFTINATAHARGQSIAGTITVSGASLSRSGSQNLYVWVDVPSGISDGTYTTNTSTQWMVEAYN